jgi:molybdopterin molybdotransferase
MDVGDVSLLALEEAQVRLFTLAAPLEPETLQVVAAAGRWAAADVTALRTQPAMPLSAMDGYAVRFAELPGPWTVVGESAAGGGLGRPLAPGEAARIFTGAPLPPGADTVLIQEEAVRDGPSLRLAGERPSRACQDVRASGSDFAKGDVLIRAGDRIGPAQVGLAISGGHAEIAVRRKPTVAMLSTGDELVPAGFPVAGAALPASNAPMLTALLQAYPADVEDRGIVPDQIDALVDSIHAARGVDILVTTGGASVGDHDLVRPALERTGAKIDFWKVALRPGKPIMIGTLGSTVVLGLPGNPVSAFVTALLFLRPLVAHLGGSASPLPLRRLVPCGLDLAAAGNRTEFLRARTIDGRIVPLRDQGSAALVGLGAADALIVRPAGAAASPEGSLVQVVDLS